MTSPDQYVDPTTQLAALVAELAEARPMDGRPHDVPAALAVVAKLRAAVDVQELELLENARHARYTWQSIADMIGEPSRQAAEQRHRRLREKIGRKT